jgi:hypothetical protein
MSGTVIFWALLLAFDLAVVIGITSYSKGIDYALMDIWQWVTGR